MISSVSLSTSGWTSATWSLHAMTFPSADSRSSIRWRATASGSEFRKCCSSWSVVEDGTRRPCLFPAVSLPRILVPAMDAWTIGMTSPSSLSNADYLHISERSWMTNKRRNYVEIGGSTDCGETITDVRLSRYSNLEKSKMWPVCELGEDSNVTAVFVLQAFERWISTSRCDYPIDDYIRIAMIFNNCFKRCKRLRRVWGRCKGSLDVSGTK